MHFINDFIQNSLIFIDRNALICYNLYIMEIKVFDDKIVIKKLADFNLDHIFECGQCFRFDKTGNNEYTGVAKDRALTISCTNDEIILHNISEADFNEFWIDYFDISRDYSAIKNRLSFDTCMTKAVKNGNGIRILKQDLFETIISFIVSQSNNIPRIKKIIENLCELCGNRIIYKNNVYYSFPTPEAILKTDISNIKAGYREKYIYNASKYVLENPDFLDKLKKASTHDAKSMLMELDGVGNKVSDCILLFGLNKTDAFPVDTWMHRIMEQLYFKKKCTPDQIRKYAKKHFGEYSGYAQQYLFYYALNHKNELKEARK